MTAFILTWKEEVWPYVKLRKLVEACQRDGFTETLWRVAAHRQAQAGHLAFLLKQGGNPRGIFGFGVFVDAPSMRSDPDDAGPSRTRATVRFERMSDPGNEPFLIPLRELVGVLPQWQIDAQASGQAALSPDAELWLVERLGLAAASGTAAVSVARFIGSGPTKGLLPSSWERLVKRDGGVPGASYAFRFGDRLLWKIGWAQDVDERLEEVNKHVPHEILKESWKIFFKQEWPDLKLAFDMEQKVLEILSANRTSGERVMCSQKDLESAWTTAAVRVRDLLKSR